MTKGKEEASELDVSDNAEGAVEPANPKNDEHETLKYSLLGPSLLKAGQDSVDQTKVSEIIYNASKNSKFFLREEQKDKTLTEKIARIQAKKTNLEKLDLSHHLRVADAYLAERELTRDLSQVIVHVDCDAFYAAVEQLDRPELASRPFAVGSGVLTTCNYVARTFGCRSGMASFVARKLCPDLICIKPDFAKYSAKASEVREVLARYDPRFESASIDEAYLNLTCYCADHSLDPADAVARMRREVHERTGITVSSGVAANARLAKICGNINKPDGQFVLPSDRAAIMAFMRRLPCRKVNGVGRVLERELQAVGVATCGDIYHQRAYLVPLFGDKTFRFLADCHLGLGRTNVQPAEDHERKSVGTERTFPPTGDPAGLRKRLREAADELEKDLRRAEVKGRTLVIKVKLHSFEVYTRQVILPRSVHLAQDLYDFSLPMLARLERDAPGGLSCRLLGLRCTNLVSTRRPDTLAFFGLKARLAGSAETEQQGGGAADESREDTDGPGDEDDSGEWERWPADGDPADVQGGGCGGASPHTGLDAEVAVAPEKGAKEDEWWDCPICQRPQPAREREFNEHIDTCLSRQTIRETVQQQQQQHAKPLSPPLPPPPPTEKKRGRPAKAPDPKQKKIRFG